MKPPKMRVSILLGISLESLCPPGQVPAVAKIRKALLMNQLNPVKKEVHNANKDRHLTNSHLDTHDGLYQESTRSAAATAPTAPNWRPRAGTGSATAPERRTVRDNRVIDADSYEFRSTAGGHEGNPANHHQH